jgi:MSHA biogenesis protein MshM
MSHLYLKHFDLHRPPFQITPDTDFFFSGSQRGGILSALLHVASHEEGIVVAVAEIGSGKTLLARLLISRLPEHVDTVYLANPCFNRDEIIIAISRDLGLPEVTSSTEENLSRLHRELVRRHALGRRVLLVIDEAHAMPSESIEEVRMLSNLETDRHKLVNIILFGQPELDVLLGDRKLRQVKDRVTNRFELPPLTLEEAEAYVDHRLRIAGWRGGRLFTAPAMAYLVKWSEGRARRINLLADKALLAAYAKAARQVEKEHVETALGELDAAPRHRSRPSPVRWNWPPPALRWAPPLP